jgi:hypothetical protein
MYVRLNVSVHAYMHVRMHPLCKTISCRELTCIHSMPIIIIIIIIIIIMYIYTYLHIYIYVYECVYTFGM